MVFGFWIMVMIYGVWFRVQGLGCRVQGFTLVQGWASIDSAMSSLVEGKSVHVL